jgi:hypothetical protein
MKIDWVFHKHECAAGDSKAEKKPPHVGCFAVDSPQPDEAVVLQGLNAKPELNGQVAIVCGPSNPQGRYPIQLRGSRVKIAIRPENLRQLGVRIKHLKRKAYSFKCSKHHLKRCSDCCFDFTVLNYLAKQLFKEGEVSPRDITIIADRYSSMEAFTEYRRPQDSGFPRPECQGLVDKEKKALLTKLIGDMEIHGPSKYVAAAVAGLTCFSARRAVLLTRPFCLSHLETALNTLEFHQVIIC